MKRSQDPRTDLHKKPRCDSSCSGTACTAGLSAVEGEAWHAFNRLANLKVSLKGVASRSPEDHGRYWVLTGGRVDYGRSRIAGERESRVISAARRKSRSIKTTRRSQGAQEGQSKAASNRFVLRSRTRHRSTIAKNCRKRRRRSRRDSVGAATSSERRVEGRATRCTRRRPRSRKCGSRRRHGAAERRKPSTSWRNRLKAMCERAL